MILSLQKTPRALGLLLGQPQPHGSRWLAPARTIARMQPPWAGKGLRAQPSTHHAPTPAPLFFPFFILFFAHRLVSAEGSCTRGFSSLGQHYQIISPRPGTARLHTLHFGFNTSSNRMWKRGKIGAGRQAHCSHLHSPSPVHLTLRYENQKINRWDAQRLTLRPARREKGAAIKCHKHGPTIYHLRLDTAHSKIRE